MSNWTTSAPRSSLALLTAALMILVCALPAGASDARAATDDGLYVTDDGAYAVYVIDYDPGAVCIAKCLLDSVGPDLTVPAYVSLDGMQVPVHGLDYLAYENHDEIRTIRFIDGISYLHGEPFSGCSNIERVYLPCGGFNMTGGFFEGVDSVFEVVHPRYDGAPGVLEYVDVTLSKKDALRLDDQLAVTISLKNDNGNFSAYLYTDGLNYVSMDPVDQEAHDSSVGSSRTFVRLGYDPATGTDYGTSRTVYYTPTGTIRQASVNIVASVPETSPLGSWTALEPLEYYFPCVYPGSDESRYSFDGYPDFLPLPLDVSAVQQSILDGTNAIRAGVGASALELSDTLSKAAMVRATEMALAENMSHTRPFGDDWSTVIDGYGNALGENLAMPSTSLADAGQVAVALWKDSPVHYNNIVNSAFTVLGVGCARGRSGALYVCQLFSNYRPSGFTWSTIDSVQMHGKYVPTEETPSVPTDTPGSDVPQDIEPAPTPDTTQASAPTEAPSASPTATQPPASSSTVTVTPGAGTTAEPTARPTSSAPALGTPRPTPSADEPFEFDTSLFSLSGGLRLDTPDNMFMPVLTGTNAASATSVGDFLANVAVGPFALRVGDPTNTQRADYENVATGDQLWMGDDNDFSPTGIFIVVKGDVLGTGKMSLSQLVRAAQAFTGSKPLDGVYQLAGDMNNDGRISLSDLVDVAKQYSSMTSHKWIS